MEKGPIQLIRPVEKKWPVVQEFGVVDPETTRFYKLYGGRHPGVDFGTPEGTFVGAAFPGVVCRTQFDHQGMGTVVAVVNNNVYSVYGHLKETGVDLGQVVRAGELIGLSGNTGGATSEPHLHFELRDLTKRTLNEMVFEPRFNEAVRQWRELIMCVTNLNYLHAIAGLGLRDVVGVRIR